ncbi:tRNA-intron lyase [Candidatus Pacearchaeota archaeon]|nr:tRNA-intron lyase [Candidatus Pacearchaeota archaeon]|tara:strand:- start:4423 stop:4932 length:510 start_codon:yes stop_codon:yes gene_type:complete
MQKITAHLIGNSITSNSKSAIDLNSSQNLGHKTRDKITYTLPEALFLLEKSQLEILDIKDRKIPFKKLLRKLLKSDKKLQLKYIVYKDLREKGLIPKTALKYGADFRVYKKKNQHSEWICFVDSEKNHISWQEFSGKTRVAHSTKKKLLLAIVDEENDVTYYEVNWKKM